nr:hypothetical protein [uncultured Arsenicibacter sp.]
MSFFHVEDFVMFGMSRPDAELIVAKYKLFAGKRIETRNGADMTLEFNQRFIFRRTAIQDHLILKSAYTKQELKSYIANSIRHIRALKKMKYDIGFYNYPTGISVANRAKQVNGDYERIAMLSHDGRLIDWKVDKSKLPPWVINEICKFAMEQHTPRPEIKLTLELIDEALKGFYNNKEKDRIVEEARRRGYVVRLSATQAHWLDSGLEKAKQELPKS